jgi:hypothetical protein
MPPVILKIVSKAIYECVHWIKSTNEKEGKPEQKSEVAFGTIFGVGQCFQRSKQKLTSASRLKS